MKERLPKSRCDQKQKQIANGYDDSEKNEMNERERALIRPEMDEEPR